MVFRRTQVVQVKCSNDVAREELCLPYWVMLLGWQGRPAHDDVRGGESGVAARWRSR